MPASAPVNMQDTIRALIRLGARRDEAEAFAFVAFALPAELRQCTVQEIADMFENALADEPNAGAHPPRRFLEPSPPDLGDTSAEPGSSSNEDSSSPQGSPPNHFLLSPLQPLPDVADLDSEPPSGSAALTPPYDSPGLPLQPTDGVSDDAAAAAPAACVEVTKDPEVRNQHRTGSFDCALEAAGNVARSRDPPATSPPGMPADSDAAAVEAPERPAQHASPAGQSLGSAEGDTLESRYYRGSEYLNFGIDLGVCLKIGSQFSTCDADVLTLPSVVGGDTQDDLETLADQKTLEKLLGLASSPRQKPPPSPESGPSALQASPTTIGPAAPTGAAPAAAASTDADAAGAVTRADAGAAASRSGGASEREADVDTAMPDGPARAADEHAQTQSSRSWDEAFRNQQLPRLDPPFEALGTAPTEGELSALRLDDPQTEPLRRVDAEPIHPEPRLDASTNILSLFSQSILSQDPMAQRAPAVDSAAAPGGPTLGPRHGSAAQAEREPAGPGPAQSMPTQSDGRPDPNQPPSGCRVAASGAPTLTITTSEPVFVIPQYVVCAGPQSDADAESDTPRPGYAVPGLCVVPHSAMLRGYDPVGSRQPSTFEIRVQRPGSSHVESAGVIHVQPFGTPRDENVFGATQTSSGPHPTPADPGAQQPITTMRTSGSGLYAPGEQDYTPASHFCTACTSAVTGVPAPAAAPAAARAPAPAAAPAAAPGQPAPASNNGEVNMTEVEELLSSLWRKLIIRDLFARLRLEEWRRRFKRASDSLRRRVRILVARQSQLRPRYQRQRLRLLSELEELQPQLAEPIIHADRDYRQDENGNTVCTFTVAGAEVYDDGPPPPPGSSPLFSGDAQPHSDDEDAIDYEDSDGAYVPRVRRGRPSHSTAPPADRPDAHLHSRDSRSHPLARQNRRRRRWR